MADGEPTIAKPEAAWGVILASTYQRLSTADVWDAIQADAASRGVTYGPEMFGQVNRMRSVANGLRTASEALARAPDEYEITGGMIGQQLYARVGINDPSLTRYHVRVGMTTLHAGQTEQDVYTLDYPGGIPTTVGELRDAVDLWADDLTNSYSLSLVSIDRIEIGAW